MTGSRPPSTGVRESALRAPWGICQARTVDRLSADRLRGRLFGLLIGFDDRVAARDVELIHEFIDVGEWGLALEQMADVLAEA